MRKGRDDVRNIALIGAAGLVGVIGTVFVLAATEEPGASPVVSADRADVQVPTLSTMDSGITATGPQRIRVRVPRRASHVVYVDGIRVDDSSDMVKGFNPDRIDRVEVLKGSAAQVKYGSEAENGTIRIFMKPRDGSDREVSDSGR